MISAHNNMSDVFDNLVISLCKFTTLLSASEVRQNIFSVLFHVISWDEGIWNEGGEGSSRMVWIWVG